MDQVNEKATFGRDDKFDRWRYYEMCTKLIKCHPASQGACTIAVDAPWGVGKSTFLWMWINELHRANDELLALTEELETKNPPILSIYYNVWESDFCDSALAPLLYSICAMVDKKKDEGWLKPEDEGLLKKFVSGAFRILATIGVKALGGDDLSAEAAGLTAEVSVGGVMNLLATRSREDIEVPKPGSIGAAYDQQLEDRAQFREALSELAQKFGGVYIFIDELDRCKPSFAIDTLDMIKHYFNIPGLTFIFGVDMVQLGHAISGRYGFNYDAEGYLSKFFEHHILLPTPSAEQMIKFCQPSMTLPPDIYKRLTDIFRACSVSPREIPRIAKASKTLISLLWGSTPVKARDTLRDLMYLLTSMRFRMTSVYNSYLNGEANWNVHHWDDKQSFWSMLSFFTSYTTTTVADCYDRWSDIINNKPLSFVCTEEMKNYAYIGRALLAETDFRDYDTFGQCIFRFMERVFI